MIKVVEKCWRVYDKKCNEYYVGYHHEEIYAKTRNQARFFYTEGEYKDRVAIRLKSEDKVEYNGNIYTRNNVIEQIKLDKLYKKRFNQLKRFSNKELFFIQKGWVGNSILWWKVNNCGYTTKINDARYFTKVELEPYLKNTDINIWSAKHVLDRVSRQVDSEDLNYKNRL